jgi:linoleoyl-CoA desaturase
LFQWGVAIQNLEIGRVLYKRKSMAKFLEELKPVNKKIGKQLFKDYVFFPLIAGPAALPVFTGNLVANGLRNIWTFTIIFCVISQKMRKYFQSLFYKKKAVVTGICARFVALLT